MDDTNKPLKVSSKTNVGKLAGSITSTYKDNPAERIVVRAVGAGAVNQALKGIIIANKQFAKEGMYCSVVPGFKELTEGENTFTAIDMNVRVAYI